jgi:hypothetical protein
MEVAVAAEVTKDSPLGARTCASLVSVQLPQGLYEMIAYEARLGCRFSGNPSIEQREDLRAELAHFRMATKQQPGCALTLG